MPYDPTPNMDTRGRNILQLIEQSIRHTEDAAERQAAEALLARVRETQHAMPENDVDDRATIPDLNPFADDF